MTVAKLAKICVLRYGKALTGYESESSEEFRYQVYGTNGPIGWWKVPLFDGHAIIIGRKGAYRGVHYSSDSGWVIDTAYHLDVTDPYVDLKWLYFKLLTLDINRLDSGSAIPSTKREDFYSLAIEIPPLDSQKRISHTLTTYDDLIENNRRRIQLLEESARLLYREWFVHLRFPGHEHVRVVDGVPEGWGQRALSELCDDVRDTVLPSQVLPETPYIGLEHIPRRSITLSEWGTADQVESSKFRFREGDMLFGKIRPYFHKVGFCLLDGITSSDAIVIRAENKLHSNYLLMLVSSDGFVAMASKTSKEGSKMPRADWKFMKQQPVLAPPQSLLESFHYVIEGIVSQLKTLAIQNRKLTQARDLLLPRLMSGEISV